MISDFRAPALSSRRLVLISINGQSENLSACSLVQRLPNAVRRSAQNAELSLAIELDDEPVAALKIAARSIDDGRPTGLGKIIVLERKPVEHVPPLNVSGLPILYLPCAETLSPHQADRNCVFVSTPALCDAPAIASCVIDIPAFLDSAMDGKYEHGGIGLTRINRIHIERVKFFAWY